MKRNIIEEIPNIANLNKTFNQWDKQQILKDKGEQRNEQKQRIIEKYASELKRRKGANHLVRAAREENK